jgi:hypothetical protein
MRVAIERRRTALVGCPFVAALPCDVRLVCEYRRKEAQELPWCARGASGSCRAHAARRPVNRPLPRDRCAAQPAPRLARPSTPIRPKSGSARAPTAPRGPPGMRPRARRHWYRRDRRSLTHTRSGRIEEQKTVSLFVRHSQPSSPISRMAGDRRTASPKEVRSAAPHRSRNAAASAFMREAQRVFAAPPSSSSKASGSSSSGRGGGTLARHSRGEAPTGIC